MNRRHLLHLMFAGFTISWSFPLQAAQQNINGVRGWRNADKLRLVLDLSGPITYRAFELTTPERLILDLHDTQLNADIGTLPLEHSPVRTIRSGSQGSGTRLVFDLAEPVELNSFLLGPAEGKGHRLVLDLQARNYSDTAAQTKVDAPLQPAKGQRDIMVVIDAGHGGKDPGAVGAKGEQEKVVALAIARQLARKINAQRGFKARLVRNEDIFIPLRKRVEVARSHNADMFISIHADAAPRRTAAGASVFALSQGGATSTTARWMAQRENKADLIGAQDLLTLKDKDPMLAGVILDMSMSATIASSLEIGNSILGRLQSVAGVHSKRVEQAGFAVLKSPDIPSVLVETGFISNSSDCRKLVDPRHQQMLAEAIFSGVRNHFRRKPPQSTLFAGLNDGQGA
ncbi:MAG: N-acetylmuramoyl-L-alanine amidase [Pseudomonas sp.]